MLETYEAYADYKDVAAMTEELVAHVARETLGAHDVERDGETIDLAPPWRRVTLRDAIREETGVDIDASRRQATAARRDAASGIDFEPEPGDAAGASSSTSCSPSTSSRS